MQAKCMATQDEQYVVTYVCSTAAAEDESERNRASVNHLHDSPPVPCSQKCAVSCVLPIWQEGNN